MNHKIIKDSNPRARFDIVVGSDGVPVSFLIRGAWDSDFNLVETEVQDGNPNLVLKRLGLKTEDHGKIIGLNNSNYEIFIEDTSYEIKKREGLKEQQQRRRKLDPKYDFEDRYKREWNFYLE